MAIKPEEVKLKDGTVHYRFVAFYKSPLTGRRRKVSVTKDKLNSRTENAARRELDEIIRQRIATEGDGTIEITLGELAKKFLAEREKQIKPSTFHNAKVFINQFVRTIGDRARVDKITTVMINRYLQNLLYRNVKPVSNSSARSIRYHLRTMFKYAVKYGYLNESPMDKVEVTWRKDDANARSIENKYLTKEECQKIFDDCENRGMEHYTDAFKLQYLTGLRFGELAALQVKNVITRNGKTFLHIDSTMIFMENPARHFISNSPKTFAGIRDVVLSPEAIDIVEQHVKNKDNDALLFAYNRRESHLKNQRPLNTNNANDMLKRIARRQHIDKPVTTHYFRHTHVSVLADLNVPLRIIQKRVGHSKSSVTRDIYLHVTKDTQEKYDDLISKLDSM